MEIKLQELIDQIKKEGVETATNEADAIINSAKAEAEKIIADAKAEAEKILATTEAQSQRMVKSGEDAISQAGRNLLISFRESVSKELNVLLAENVTAVYSSKKLADIIINVVSGWANKPDAENIAVILNSDDLKALEETVIAGVKEKLQSGVTLNPNDNFNGGFRIAVNEGTAYYDYSAEAVTDMLSNYLSPKVTELLKKAE